MRGVGRGSGGLAGALAGAALFAAMGCSITTSVSGDRDGFRDDRTTIAVVTTQIGGKNVFVPSTIVVTAGRNQSLSFYNTTDTPHGMTIPGLGIAEILPPGEEHVVALPPLSAGHIYQVNCHLHPPHRSATLVVVRGR